MEAMDNSIDIVIPYVDSSDPEWQTRYCQAAGNNNAQDNCRFRNWKNLQYLFRGIEKNMPWIHRVFLVVQSESQIPGWLNRQNDKLQIVYHDEYIPDELLPTFNVNTIELFMHRIPSISPHFIIFNDDVFPIGSLEPNSFFNGYKARISQTKGLFQNDCQYLRMLKNNVNVLRRYFPAHTGFLPDHITHNIIRQAMEEIVESELSTIVKSLKYSPMRDERNMTIQIVKDYTILSNRAVLPNEKCSEIQLSDKSVITHLPDVKIVCFNDTENVKNEFGRLQKKINGLLQNEFPCISQFEKQGRMKFVEYCDTADLEKLVAACVSVYSFRINGKLPPDTEYILYCPDVKQASQNAMVSKVFETVQTPPIQEYIDSNYKKINAFDTHRNSVTWAKFACWVQTPCDGAPVFHADYDTLCFGSILDAIPNDNAIFSGRKNAGNNISCNGGFYCKNPEFDKTNAGEFMLAPIFDNAVFSEAKKLWSYSDEIGVAWYFHNMGLSKFHDLGWKFNMPVYRHKRSGKSIKKNDVRVLHYMGNIKPWHESSIWRYKHQHKRWIEMKDRMCNELEIR